MALWVGGQCVGLPVQPPPTAEGGVASCSPYTTCQGEFEGTRPDLMLIPNALRA